MSDFRWNSLSVSPDGHTFDSAMILGVNDPMNSFVNMDDQGQFATDGLVQAKSLDDYSALPPALRTKSSGVDPSGLGSVLAMAGYGSANVSSPENDSSASSTGDAHLSNASSPQDYQALTQEHYSLTPNLVQPQRKSSTGLAYTGGPSPARSSSYFSTSSSADSPNAPVGRPSASPHSPYDIPVAQPALNRSARASLTQQDKPARPAPQHEKRKVSDSLNESGNLSRSGSGRQSARVGEAPAKTTALKDRRSSTRAHSPPRHTHDQGDSDGESPAHDKKSTSERRKEQNRQAQRNFRERRERQVKELEDKVAALEESKEGTATENQQLRDLVNNLREENERLKVYESAFTFSVPANAGSAALGSSESPLSRSVGDSASSISPSFDRAVTTQPAVAPVFDLGSASSGSAGPSRSTSGDPQPDIFSSAYLPFASASNMSFASVSEKVNAGKSNSPLATPSIDDLLNESVLSPNGTSVNFKSGWSQTAQPPAFDGAAFNSWRDAPADEENKPAGELDTNGSAFDDLLASMGMPAPGEPSTSLSPLSETSAQQASVTASDLGAVTNDDIDGLCADMRAKATCKVYAAMMQAKGQVFPPEGCTQEQKEAWMRSLRDNPNVWSDLTGGPM
ncbi:uncharacterized protein L969DRAFT_84287 [Mixia osmundae IAM 14324]|uniref:BZIP domain-containing protein n=1 Tax=Mixia osmundae (strain CBS 9802 / IAM 14324 / JCM 22182 / KY 12970) TaxID=764103 RepID=G7E2T6_MIXOS|nr:uncharacterized protein L969DRAFT_84287 [Mixia osmundae IAM 14324]KEI42429.1 hypothetical protein L969DRAFT_84287 [Mixia osmundae IAM 14324]GAA97280.1 hypothetical protein E5Q_03958 [Mixia osmundae IAM 14324]